MSQTRDLLRHTVATLGYRAAKAVRDAPPRFGDFRTGPTSRTPRDILAHMGDLLDWALHLARGTGTWKASTPMTWEEEVARFFSCLKAFDDYLASDAPLGHSIEVLFQGPVADALTHTGQLNMLRRLAGAPVKGESYARAHIAAGQVGLEQPAAVVEFD